MDPTNGKRKLIGLLFWPVHKIHHDIKSITKNNHWIIKKHDKTNVIHEEEEEWKRKKKEKNIDERIAYIIV